MRQQRSPWRRGRGCTQECPGVDEHRVGGRAGKVARRIDRHLGAGNGHVRGVYIDRPIRLAGSRIHKMDKAIALADIHVEVEHDVGIECDVHRPTGRSACHEAREIVVFNKERCVDGKIIGGRSGNHSGLPTIGGRIIDRRDCERDRRLAVRNRDGRRHRGRRLIAACQSDDEGSSRAEVARHGARSGAGLCNRSIIERNGQRRCLSGRETPGARGQPGEWHASPLALDDDVVHRPPPVIAGFLVAEAELQRAGGGGV